LRSLHDLSHWHIAIAALFVLGSSAIGSTPIHAQSGNATSSAVPSNSTPSVGEQVEVSISIDVTDVDAPDGALGSFSGSLAWDPAVLAYNSDSGILAGFTGVVNPSSGNVIFNGAKPTGVTGDFIVLTITFDVVGPGSSDLDLEYSAMAAAFTFRNLLPLLTINDGHVKVSSGISYSLTIVVEPAKGGTTDPEVGVHPYPEGTVVGITAMTNASYEFDHWGGSCAGSGACQVTMNADMAVTAYFTELPLACYTLTLSHTGQGSDPVAVPTNSTGCPSGRYTEGETINLSGAIPDTGWYISGWAGTSQDNSTAGTNSLTMPASAHAVSVSYKTYIHLPIIFGGPTTTALGRSQTSNTGQGEAIARSLSTPGTEGLDSDSPRISTQQIPGEQDLMTDLTITEENPATASSWSNADTEVGGSHSAPTCTQEIARGQNLTTDPEHSDGGNLTSVNHDSPIAGVLGAIEQLSCVLPLFFVLVVLVVSAFLIIKHRFRSSE
jgi:hypothetical protein